MLLPYPEFIKNYVLFYWKPGKKFLEVGCGVSYLRSFIKEDYVGVDITDEDYIEGSKRSVDIVCDGQSIPLESNSVDIIYIKSTLYLMNASEALKEFYRLLKPGGTLLIFDYNYRTQNKLKKRPGDTYTYSLWSQFGLWREVRRAGFVKVQLIESCFPRSNGAKRYLNLFREEILGQWANIVAEKR